MINAYHRKVMEIHIYFWGIYYIVRLAVLNRQPGTKYINVWRTPKQMGLYFMKKMLVIKKTNSNNVRFYNLDRYSISNKKSQPKNKFDCALRKTLFIVSLNISKANMYGKLLLYRSYYSIVHRCSFIYNVTVIMWYSHKKQCRSKYFHISTDISASFITRPVGLVGIDTSSN